MDRRGAKQGMEISLEAIVQPIYLVSNSIGPYLIPDEATSKANSAK